MQPTAPEIADKFRILGETYASIESLKVARDGGPPSGRIPCALSIQQLQQQAATIRATLPKPKLIWSKE